MSEDIKIHVVPHSHWDREWYMPFEAHRYRLVRLIDEIIECMEKNPEFKYYHLDGQTIVLEDYLEIKPYMKPRLQKLISDGRLQIGPWYVLQDEYLISDEANVRNMLIGLEICSEWKAEPVMIGYLPDSFGNIAQMPQLLKQFGIDCAVFGRGFGLKNSEIIWESEDSSRVTGVWLAGWYNNAAELPSEKEGSRAAVEKILKRYGEYSAVNEYVGMNGSDHQPLQKNLTQAIAAANGAAPEGVSLIHSNLADYTNAVKRHADKFPVFRGEISGQFTNGCNRLAATASSRIYLKQLNKTAENKLEREAEPVSVMALLNGGEYQYDFIKYAWKKLLENHAHDSICGCSVDSVCSEMVTRFNKTVQVADAVSKEAEKLIASKIDISGRTGLPFAVFNTSVFDRSDVVTAELECPDGFCGREVLLKDSDGNDVPFEYSVKKNQFTYKLPDDAFRKVEYRDIIKIRFLAESVPSVGYKTYFLESSRSKRNCVPMAHGDNFAENAFEMVIIEPNGSLTIIDKATKNMFTGLNILEDTEDIGDEYTYIKGPGRVLRTLDTKAEISIQTAACGYVTFKVRNVLPARSGKGYAVGITTYVTVYRNTRRIDIHNEIDNRAGNHRLRALFKNSVKTDKVYAHSQFDVLARDIKTGPQWTCEGNEQRMQSFAALKDNEKMIMVASRALHEYEVLRDGSNTLCVTLLRAVDRMGDWGDFPTPGAQCLGENTADYALFAGASGEYCEAAKQALMYASDAMPAVQVPEGGGGTLPLKDGYISAQGVGVWSTALKRAEKDGAAVLRLYNFLPKENSVKLSFDRRFKAVSEANTAEEKTGGNLLSEESVTLKFRPKEIKTLILED